MKKMTLALPVLAMSLFSTALLMQDDVQAQSMEKSAVVQEKKQDTALSAEQRANMHKAVEAFRVKMQPVRQDLFVKQQELQALHNAANPDVAAVSRKATEISALRASLDAEKRQLGLALDKAMGLEPGTHALRAFKAKKGGHGRHDKMGFTAQHGKKRHGAQHQRGQQGFYERGHNQGHMFR